MIGVGCGFDGGEFVPSPRLHNNRKATPLGSVAKARPSPHGSRLAIKKMCTKMCTKMVRTDYAGFHRIRPDSA